MTSMFFFLTLTHCIHPSSKNLICVTTVTRDLKPLRNHDKSSLAVDGISEADEVKIPDLPNRSEHNEWGVLPTVIRTRDTTS